MSWVQKSPLFIQIFVKVLIFIKSNLHPQSWKKIFVDSSLFGKFVKKSLVRHFKEKKNLYNLILRIYLQYFVQGGGERLG